RVDDRLQRATALGEAAGWDLGVHHPLDQPGGGAVPALGNQRGRTARADAGRLGRRALARTGLGTATSSGPSLDECPLWTLRLDVRIMCSAVPAASVTRPAQFPGAGDRVRHT